MPKSYYQIGKKIIVYKNYLFIAYNNNNNNNAS